VPDQNYFHTASPHALLAGDQIPEAAAVNIEQAPQDTGMVPLDELSDMSVKALGCVIGK